MNYSIRKASVVNLWGPVGQTPYLVPTDQDPLRDINEDQVDSEVRRLLDYTIKFLEGNLNTKKLSVVGPVIELELDSGGENGSSVYQTFLLKVKQGMRLYFLVSRSGKDLCRNTMFFYFIDCNEYLNSLDSGEFTYKLERRIRSLLTQGVNTLITRAELREAFLNGSTKDGLMRIDSENN